MKPLVPIAILLFGFSYISRARPVDEREIGKGTVLNYIVKDGSVSYKLKATVVEWNIGDNIKIQWQTTGAKIMKGTFSMANDALNYSSDMKVKPKQGVESLGEGVCRWFVGFPAYDDLYSSGIESDLKIDGDDVTLQPNEDITEKNVLYNNVKTTMGYAEGATEDSDDKVIIGFTGYNSTVIILNKYIQGSFSMNLVSIQNPVLKTTKGKKEVDGKEEASVMPNHIIKEEPDKKLVLTKMEPGKFAVVKTKYPVLARIENYDPTNGGAVKKPVVETYEYRIGSSNKNPPSLIDCLTADLLILYNKKDNLGIGDMTETISSKNLPATAAKRILGIYLAMDYMTIPGYRPWSNWSFVKSLTGEQRNQLAKELQGYIADYGFILE